MYKIPFNNQPFILLIFYFEILRNNVRRRLNLRNCNESEIVSFHII